MIKIAIVGFYLFMIQANAFAQLQNTDSTTMYYLRLNPFDHSKNIKHEFVCAKGSWHSPVLTPIMEDSLGVFIKVYIPDSIYQPQMYLSCKAMEINQAADTVHRAVVRTELLDLTTVQLSLTPNPRKVLIYMIPTRIWLNGLKKTNWKTNGSLINNYLLKDDYITRNLIVGIDDTEYTLIFQLGNKYIVKTHKLQPGRERFQQERVDFAKKLFSD